jgi:PAS domain S-box-containing protein
MHYTTPLVIPNCVSNLQLDLSSSRGGFFQMKIAPKPKDETARLEALYRYQILDTVSEECFDNITEMAAQICNAPFSTITLIDENREWYKSRVGITDEEAPRNISFCAHTIIEDDLLIVPDALEDPRFFDNPFVLEDPPLRFYAGMSFSTADGYKLGTLCVMDKVPRELDEHQQQALRILSQQVTAQLELRRNLKLRVEADIQLNEYTNKLELLVTERTTELIEINKTLEQEVKQRKEVEREMRSSEDKFIKAFLCVPDAISIIKMKDGTFIDVNVAFEELSGHNREQVIGRTVFDLGFWANLSERDIMLKNLNETGQVRDLAVSLRHKSGELRDCLLSVERVKIGTKLCLLTVTRDITEHRLAERQIQISHNHLRDLMRRIEAAREEERTVIARDIHDELGQNLTGLRMDLSWLQNHLPKTLVKLRERARSMIELVDKTVDYVRALSSSLRPAMLDDIGLEAAIEWQIQGFRERTKCQCTLDLDCEKLDINIKRDTVIFRIFQEALTNVARHAQAQHVAVSLHQIDSCLLLTITDDGIGINEQNKMDSQSLGLIGMQERADAFGGHVEFETLAEGGTRIILSMPLASMAA